MSEPAFDPTQIALGATAPDNEETRQARQAASTADAELLKRKLAAAYQVIADQELDDGVNGHISLRVPGAPHFFWVANLGQLFNEVTPATLALVNHKGEIVDGGPVINLAGFLIHSAIHEARPDVHCAVHTHPRAGCAFSALARPLEMIDQNCCSFYDDVGIYGEYTGVVLDGDQTRGLVDALGYNNRGLILQNHGLITVAETVEQATIDMIDLERTCDTNLRALSTGLDRVTVPDAAAEQARAVLRQPLRYTVLWEAMVRDLKKRNLAVADFA